MPISDIKSTTTEYKVVKGDTFGAIAQQCVKVGMSGYAGLSLWGNGGAVEKLQKFNPDIENVNYISIGQKIILQGTAAKKTTNNTQRVKITNIGLQSDTERTVFATWSWNKSNTDHYEVRWRYNTENNIAGGFPGTSETVNEKLSVYSGAPENATSVTLTVKPVSKTYKSGNKEIHYWTADWSTIKTYDFSNNPPLKPPKPTDVKISNKAKLTVKLTDLAVNAPQIQFKIIKNDTTTFKTGNATINTTNNTVSFSCTVDPGCYYKVLCRSVKNGVYSDWSEESDNVSSEPATSAGIYALYAINELSQEPNKFVVRVDWHAVSGADNYQVQYTTHDMYFDSNPQGVTTIDLQGTKDDPTELTHTIISEGLAGGSTYFFRVRAVTNSKNGAWSEIESIVLGEKPTIPTTWSSTTTAIVGEPLILYWLHNSVDGSKQTYARLELTVDGVIQEFEENGVKVPYLTIENLVNPDEENKTSSYEIDTSKYEEGAEIKWRVQTAGIKIDHDTGDYDYSDWSAHREINVYAQPSVSLTVTNSDGNVFSELTSFPINISAYAGPDTQDPIGYHLTVLADEQYETTDNYGNVKMVNKGAVIYSKYFDVSDNPLQVSLSAGDLNLSNNISYKITCTVCMNSGLTAEESVTFSVGWVDTEELWPNAEVIYDSETYSTSIRPYCTDESNNLVDGVTLAVYRREFDGTFTELITDLNNTDSTYITDPHPSLDYARYRIVATYNATGAVSYYDMPGCYIGEKAAIIQWDEEWSDFNLTNEDILEERFWSGSLLKLKYNIDVSDQYEKDTELIKYVGRKHPVSYHGTQIGHTSTWNFEIEKDDVETLYALRRLSIWQGNVYVREPSGSGYWASIDVSFSQTHRELTIPVTIAVTRVEGGI